MITSVRFYLSHVPLKWDFITFNMNVISLEKHIADTDMVNDFMCTHPKVLLHMRSYDFYDKIVTAHNSTLRIAYMFISVL